jgi:Stress responsive A/B Barrel Domain
MLRRWEMYGFADAVTEDQIDGLAGILRGCGRYIPEVLDSAVGRNGSNADITLVWEHSYEDAEAYARYIRHPEAVAK